MVIGVIGTLLITNLHCFQNRYLQYQRDLDQDFIESA